MFNNKGQSLVIFVLLLPVLLLVLVLVIDVGKAIVLKQELNNISYIALDYGLEHIHDNNIDKQLEDLIKLNKDDIDKIDVYIEEDKIYVNLEDKVEGIFSSFIDISIFDVKTSSVGYFISDEKRIEKMGD